MKNLQKLLIIIILSLGLYSCCDHRLSQTLADIEPYIDSRPDSALAAIRQIDTTELRGRAAKAKYSLLHAIALDKNYIDTADTRVVQPAVDYYDRHGTPEQRLKAYMYLGTEQYNAGRYNQAIVSFSHAAEFAEKVDDQNLLGILYSIMADTFTKTRDHTMASSYIERSLECFRRCGRKDQERLVRLREAGNFSQMRMWAKADSCFRALLSDKELDHRFRGKVEINYAMFLTSLPEQDDSSAFAHFSNALRNGGRISDSAQLAAYAYLTGVFGNRDLADSIWNRFSHEGRSGQYDYHYWRHREKLRAGDYRGAYMDLWSAMRAKDEMITGASALSAAASRQAYLEVVNSEKDLQVKTRGLLIIVILLICLLMGMTGFLTYLLYRRNKRLSEEREDRMNLVIESLENRVLKAQNDARKDKYAFLSDIYEEAYRISDRPGSEKDPISQAIRSLIGDLRSDVAARARFERMIDKDMDGMMTRLRKGCPGLSESEYMMACYYFAGFDNTAVMVVMNLTSTDNVRTRKKRLRQKIAGFGKVGEEFLRYF